jgi:hypothetical protein
MREFATFSISLLFLSTVFGQEVSKPIPPPPTPETTKPAATSESSESRKRVELNLLGKEDTSAGESRRNENIQFNLVDNNALKELNIRVGASATVVDQFRPERGYFGSEFGNPPSATLHVQPSARPGWHGNLFATHLNSAFTARSFFQVGDVKPARENRYGFSTGLALWRGSFLTLQGSQEKLRGNVNGNVLVPIREERTPLTTDPARRAIVARFLAAYPDQLPNRTDINARALNTNAPQSINSDDALVRLEQSIGTADRIIASHQFVAQEVDAFQLVAGQNPNTNTKSHRSRLSWNRLWSANTTSIVTLGFDRVGSLLLPDETSVGTTVAIAGLQTLGPLAIIPIDRAQNNYRFEAQMSSNRGRHTWIAGGGMVRRQFNGIETDAHRGYYSFSNDFGRTGIDNLRYGTPSQHIVSIGNVHRGFRQTMPYLFVGDTWKATSQLSLQWGLRYEAVGRPTEVNNLNQVPYGCDCNNFGPRVSLAYNLSPRLGVIRAAFGVHFGEILPVSYSQIRFSPPGSVKLVIPAPDLIDPLSSIKQTGQQADARGNLYLLDPDLATPYSYQYNFTWEPLLFKTWRLQLGYIGSRSHKLLTMWYLNRAHAVAGIPQTTATINERRARTDLADVRSVLNGSQGYFDAARVTVIAPRVKGFTIESSYWFSKAIDLGADYTNTAYDADSRLSRSQSEFETHVDRKALSLFDQPHSFLGRFTYETPSKALDGWTGRLLSNWNATAVVLVKKGTPFAVTTLDGPGFGNVDGNGADRPNLLDPSILGRTIGNPDTSRQLLPREAFSFIAPTQESGNLGSNVFRRGAIRNVNASIARNFPLHNGVRLTLRAESINLLNTPQFAEPGSILGTPEFGFITNTLNDGRTVRLGLSLGW